MNLRILGRVAIVLTLLLPAVSAVAQVTVDQNLDGVGGGTKLATPKTDLIIVQRNMPLQQTLSVVGGRRGFFFAPFGEIFIPIRPITITNYTDNNVAPSTGNSREKVTYDQQLLTERGNAALTGNVGGGGGLTFGYDFKNINISLLGYIGYIRQTAAWSADYSNSSYLATPTNLGIVNQGWDLAANNIIAAIGGYYDIFLGNIMAIGLGGDVGINYSLATLGYNQNIRANVVTTIGSVVSSSNINVNSMLSTDVGGVQGFIAPRINIDFYIPLGKPNTTPVLSGLILNFFIAYYYPFNNIKFSFDPNAVDNNGIKSDVSRSGEVQGLMEGLATGLGVALQF